MYFPSDKVEQQLRKQGIPATCFMCQKICEVWEIVHTGDVASCEGWEVWNYCDECKIDSFHIIPKD